MKDAMIEKQKNEACFPRSQEEKTEREHIELHGKHQRDTGVYCICHRNNVHVRRAKHACRNGILGNRRNILDNPNIWDTGCVCACS